MSGNWQRDANGKPFNMDGDMMYGYDYLGEMPVGVQVRIEPTTKTRYTVVLKGPQGSLYPLGRRGSPVARTFELEEAKRQALAALTNKAWLYEVTKDEQYLADLINW